MQIFRVLSVSLLVVCHFFFAAHLKADSPAARVLDISESSIEGRIAASITFSVPIKTDVALDQWLSVESAAGKTVSGSWVVGDKAKQLYFTNVEPEQSYVISVKKGLPFSDWRLLEKTASQTIKLRAVTPQLGFAGNGNLLADSLIDGLPVISVNAHHVDVDFYRIPEHLLSGFLTENTRRGQQQFWRVKSFVEQLEHVYTGRFDLNLAPNQTATSYLPIKGIAALKPQGVYVAIMRRAGEYTYSYPATWFATSDLGLQLRIYAQFAEVNVTSLAQATAKEGVALTLLDRSGKKVAVTHSDSNGFATFSKSEIDKANLLVASQEGHTSLVRLFGPELDLSEFPVTGAVNQAQQLFFYSERNLYRPGEQLRVNALVRDSDGKMTAAQVVTFKLLQPSGRVASEQRLKPNALGHFSSQWQLPKDAALGEWTLQAQLAGQKAVTYTLQVEDFLPERLQLALTHRTMLNGSDNFIVDVDGQYLYGAAAAGNTLQSELVTNLAAHPFKAYSNYYFSNPQLSQFKTRRQLDDFKLDAKGQLQLRPANRWHRAKTPVQLKLYASLLDSGGRPVNRIASAYALPAAHLVGIKPLFEEDTAPYSSQANFEIVFSDGQRKLEVSGLELKLIREKRNYHWLYTESEGWTSDYTERHFPVVERQLSIKAGQVSKVSLPVDWGHYRLEVYNPVTKVTAGYKFRAGWSAEETVMAGRPDRIGLALDKQRYRAGDTVNVEIKAPAAGRGYLLVESDKVLHRQLIEVSKQGAIASFEVDETWKTHNLYVSVSLIQPGEDRQQKLPRRMMGIAPLTLDRQARKLQVSLSAPSEIRPSSQLDIPLTVHSVASSPSRVQVTVAAVDLGVLNIAKFATPDPFTGFFQQRAYQVSARDSFSDLISADDGVMASLKFGGDSDLVQSGEADPNVEIVSLFSGVVDVDSQGQALVSLQVPDFNGRLRLMAVAFSEDSFGSAEQEVQVAAPIVAQLTKARLLRPGDRSQLALDLSNLTQSEQVLDINLTLERGLSFSDDLNARTKNIQLTLDRGAKEVTLIPIQVENRLGNLGIELTINNIRLKNQPALSLSRDWQLTVLPAWEKSERRWQKVLSANQELSVNPEQLDDLLSASLSGQMSLSTQPAFSIANHFNALKAYPYGCLEQTTSGVFPQLYVDDPLLAELGIQGSEQVARATAINLAIQRLQSMQRGSGGFGLWSQHSPEEFWLSVYVLDFLTRAQQAGYVVPEENLNKALQRVVEYLRSPKKINSYDRQIDPRTKFAVRAYAAHVLAKRVAVPLSILRRMFDARSQGESPLAILQLGLALQLAGDQIRADSAINEALANVEKFGTAGVYYASQVRDLALASFWLIEAKQQSSQWLPLLQELSARLAQRQWLSTQERNALFLIARALRDVENSQLHAAYQLAGQTSVAKYQAIQLPITSEQLKQQISVKNLAQENLYFNLSAAGYSKKQPEPENAGLQIARRYYQLNGEPFTAQKLRSGDKLIVELTVQSPQRLRHALVVDLLPAGLEIENQNLADSYDQTQLEVEGVAIAKIMSNLAVKYREHRDDRFVMALDLASKRTQRIYYLVRAVTPGIYQIPPTFGEDMYRPEIRHQGGYAGSIQVINR